MVKANGLVFQQSMMTLTPKKVTLECEYEGEWKDGKIWNGKKYDNDRNVTATFVNGEEKNDYLFP